MHRPTEIHLKVALRILTYIKGSPSKTLLYKKHGYLQADSNYAGDKRDRKSTSGYCIYVEGNLVS